MLERPHDIANILSHQSSSERSMAAAIVNKIYIYIYIYIIYIYIYVYNGCWWRKSSYLKCLVNIYVPRRSFEIVITKWYNEKFWLHLKRSYKEKIKYFVITIICFLWYAWFSWHAWSLARRWLIKHISDDRFCPSKHKSGK